MKIEKVNINDLISPDYNPRQITPEALESLKTSLKEFGYIDYLIVNEVNNHVVGGNQRLTALKQLGYNEIDVILIHEPDIDREKMINIRLNNSSGEWNTDKLESILEDLELKELDITLTGFDIETLEIQDINQTIPQTETTTTDLNTGLKTENNKIEITEDDYTEPEPEMKVHVATGDLYQLGNHYLFCGDSTSEKNLEILLKRGEREREP